MVLVKDPPIPPLDPPPPPKAPPAEPITEEPPPEVVDAPGPWLAIGAIASLAGVIISHYGFKSIVNTLFVKPTGFLGRLFRHVFPSPQEMVQAISRAVTHDLAQYFALSSPGVARWLTKEAKVVNALTGEIMANAEATYDALVRLRVITIPTLIRDAVRPLVKAINGLDSRVTVVEDKIAGATAYINTELRRLPWGQGATFPLAMRQFMGAFNQLWTQFFDYTRPKLDLFFNVTLPALNRKVNEMFTDLYTTGKDGLDGIRSRLLNVETEIKPIVESPSTWTLGALGLGLAGAFTAAEMAVALDNLTCKNTQTAAKSLCGMSDDWLLKLLAGGLLFELVIDPKLVASVGREVEGAIDWAFREMAGV